MQSPGPTKAFAHIAADQIESWSNPVGLFAGLWLENSQFDEYTGPTTINTLIQLSRSPSLSLCLSHVNIEWCTTKEVKTHDDLIRHKITCQHHTFAACTLHTFPEFRFESSWVMRVMSHGYTGSSTSKYKRNRHAFSVLFMVLTEKSFF